jgi:hypothetical protein
MRHFDMNASSSYAKDEMVWRKTRALNRPECTTFSVQLTVSNSTWASGDWDGDGNFTSANLVFALADGGYEQGPRGKRP